PPPRIPQERPPGPPADDMIAISNLTKYYGEQTLFSTVNLHLNKECCYGVVGANGSGKSTFLRLLAGEEVPSDGTVSIPKRARVGVLRQDHFAYDDELIVHVAMMGRRQLWSAIAEKERLLALPREQFPAERYAELEELILHQDGYTLEAQAGEVLEGLGIPTEVHRQPMRILSGGFKLRVLLAQVLAADPEVLLLDEPTNHLDILSIRWLEKFLAAFKGCALVISHDHRFLDNVSTHILDVDYETIVPYTGNYTDFALQKQEERARKEAGIARQEKEIEAHRANIERFKAKATKARQAASKKKLLDRIVIERLPRTSRRYPTFRFQQVRPSGKVVVEAEAISKRYGSKEVLDGVGLTVQRGDRLAIIGPNGIGKSTLLKILMGKLEAEAGTTAWGYETYPGYFAQDHREQLEESAETVESWLWRYCPGEPIGFVRGRLGAVLFSGDEVQKKLTSLSGGEAARLIFARLGIEKPNVLVLDEPTNHLDLEAIDALVEGLEKFDGTLIFVSHDRWFVQRLANRILEITPQGIRDFRGTYDEYLDRLGDDHLDAGQALLRVKRERQKQQEPRATRERSPAAEKEAQRQAKRLAAERDEVTRKLEQVEARIHEINEKFCNPGFFDATPRNEVQRLEGEQKRLAGEIAALMARWEALEQELGALSLVAS
ncbi:MAG TPA: ABC-F family ATP-binding cassette domain-containing protein, partial [Thermoanaerobaculia bacterium]|nr:ABC-F family ATP-binding cassette domain-containing protein [Thermoanaerobaculia bacterium]